jgi:hypothetical protein
MQRLVIARCKGLRACAAQHLVQLNLHKVVLRAAVVSGLGFGVWGLRFGVWGLGFGVWGLVFGVRSFEFSRQMRALTTQSRATFHHVTAPAWTRLLQSACPTPPPPPPYPSLEQQPTASSSPDTQVIISVMMMCIMINMMISVMARMITHDDTHAPALHSITTLPTSPPPLTFPNADIIAMAVSWQCLWLPPSAAR